MGGYSKLSGLYCHESIHLTIPLFTPYIIRIVGKLRTEFIIMLFFSPIHMSVLMRKTDLVRRYCCILQVLESSIDLLNEDKMVRTRKYFAEDLARRQLVFELASISVYENERGKSDILSCERAPGTKFELRLK